MHAAQLSGKFIQTAAACASGDFMMENGWKFMRLPMEPQSLWIISAISPPTTEPCYCGHGHMLLYMQEVQARGMHIEWLVVQT